MGFGIASIGTSQKKEIAGPPFNPTSANNGLSVDPVTFKIVLGNNVGDPGQPAQLLSDREIVTEDLIGNLFGIILNSIVTGVTTRIDGQLIQIIGGNGAAVSIDQSVGDNGSAGSTIFSGDGGVSTLTVTSGVGGTSVITVRTDADRLDISPDGVGHINFSVGGLGVWSINTATFFTQIGPTLVADNGATLQITGTNTRRLFTQSQGAGTYNVDRDLDSDKLFRNSAAANLALPNMAGANARPGFVLGATCFNAAGITITAFAGQTIRFGSLATSAGGTISSTDVGAYVKIINIDSTTWVTETFNGAWVLT